MVASTESKPNKTAFITDQFSKNPKSNSKAVNEAWAKAGHAGSISPTFVSKLRKDLGLTGNLRARSKAIGTNGTNGAYVPSAAKSRKRSAKARDRTPSKATSGSASSSPSGVTKKGDRSRMLDEVEAGIDHLIFTLKVNGGMPEVEAALRSTRRLLTRSHGA